MSRPPASPGARLREQLDTLPAFRALLRSVEEALVADAGPLPPPVLDLGCGDGDFAARALVGEGALLGVDPDLWALAEATRRRPPFTGLAGADGSALPFPSRSLGTVIANSVLEHVPELDRTLDEVARVLRPGGRLVVTAPCHRFPRLLAGHRLLTALATPGVADAYARWLNRRAPHHHLLPAEEWERRLAALGIETEERRYYFPPRTLRTFELLHYLGAPTLLARRLTGQWVPWRNPLTRALAVRWLEPRATTEPAPDGACVYLRAVRR